MTDTKQKKADYKSKITKLRQKGKSYRSIADEVGCSLSLVSYYLNDNTRETVIRRASKRALENKELKREYVYNYLSNNHCEMCGMSDPRALEFDHIDKADKRKDICTMIKDNYSIETLQKEMDKCRVLCANCHRIHTCEQNNSYRHKKHSEEYWIDTYNPSTETVEQPGAGIS